MLSRIKGSLSRDAECTVLLVRAVLAIIVGVGILWYHKEHLYGGRPGVSDNLNALAVNSGPPSETISGITVSIVTDTVHLILFTIEILLPFLSVILFRFAFCDILCWLGSRKPQNSWDVRESEDTRDENI